MSAEELSDYPVISPVRGAVVSSGFGMRKHPVYNIWRFHTGIDIPEREGTPVYATGNGIVVRKGFCKGYGNYIEIEHDGGFRSFYAHLGIISVNTGDLVSITRQIACVGSSGITTGSHLHYEIRKGNRFLNPVGWCCCFLDMVPLLFWKGKPIATFL